MKRYLVVPIAALLALSAVVALRAAPQQSPVPAAPAVRTKPAAESSVAGYRDWVRVNPKPVAISSTVAFLCMASTKRTMQDAVDPHVASPSEVKPGDYRRTRYATVYVNALGADAMLKAKNPTFPEGSIVVKEKLVKPQNEGTPELLTVMRKREKGYNPAGGDWEYLVFDGAGKKIQEQGRLKNCVSCHEESKATDYVVRTYLPDAVEKALK